MSSFHFAHRGAACLLVALSAGGCLGGSSRARYAALEQEAAAGATAPLPALGDDPFPGAQVLERDLLVEEVLRRNPGIRAARAGWRAALARVPQVVALEDPMLGYGVAPPSFGSDTVEDAHTVELSQSFPFPGKLALRGEVALAEAEAARGDFQAVRLRLATMASLLYDQLYLVERAAELNGEHVELLGEFLRIATARYEVGEASQQDPLTAELEQALLLRRDVGLRTQASLLREQMNALMHRHPDLPLPPPPQRLVPLTVEEAPVDEQFARALEERPELGAADARVRSGEARTELARRDFYPDFTLVAAYRGQMPERDVRPFVGFRFNVPLQIGRRRAALRQAESELERAQSERESLEDQVRLAVHGAVDRLGEARAVLALYGDRLLPAARDRIEAARAGFVSGRNSFLALIEAERDLRNVRLGYEEALTDLSRRAAELAQATGVFPGLEGARR